MGDRKPSQFYRDLKKLASPSTSDDSILTLSRNRLPAHVQYVLEVLEDPKVENLIRIADRIKESCPEKGRIVAIETERTEDKRQRRTSDTMNDRLCRIEAQINALRLDIRRCRRSSSRHRKSSSKDRSSVIITRPSETAQGSAGPLATEPSETGSAVRKRGMR